MARMSFVLPHVAKLEISPNIFKDFRFSRGDIITITDVVTYYEKESAWDIPTRRGVFRSIPDGKFEFVGEPEVYIVGINDEFFGSNDTDN